MANDADDPRREKGKLRSQAWFGRAGPRRLRAPQLDEEPGHARTTCSTAGRSSASATPGRELTPCNAHFRELAEHVKRGVLRGRRLPARIPGDVARRDAAAADGDAVPQPRQHGRRGIDPRQSDRRRRAADRLRQDHAGAADGRGELRPADDRRLRRADAERQVPRRATSARAPHVWKIQRGGARRRDDAATTSSRPRACMRRSPGHCMTMGTASTMASHGRGARHRPAGQRRDPGRRCAPQRARAAWPAGASSRWCTRTCACRRSSRARRSRTRSASTRAIGGSTNAVIHLLAHRRPHRRRRSTLDDWDRLGRDVPCHRQPDAVGPVPDGGLLLRRRPAGGDAGARASGLLHRDALTVNGKTHRREHRRTRRTTIARSSRRSTSRSRPKAGIAVLRGNLAPRRRRASSRRRRRRR